MFTDRPDFVERIQLSCVKQNIFRGGIQFAVDEILTAAKALEEQIISDRRHLHQIPEVGMELPESAAYIEQRLTEMGISFQRCGVMTQEVRQKYIGLGQPDMPRSTGIVAAIGSGSPCFLLRADFDALPMEEINDLPFRSRRPAAHMCGHDAHAAMLLGAAKLLKDREQELKGTVKLMFQPGEELGYGSKTMIDAGLLDHPKVDAAMAIHIMSTTPAGMVTYSSGIASSSLDTFVVRIQGKGGHTSAPNQTIDPLMIANQVYTAANLLMTREVSPQVTATLSAGVFSGGTASNIIPDTAQVQFGMRTYDVSARAHILERLPQLIDHYVKAWRGSYELATFNCPCTYTDPTVLQELMPALRQAAGANGVSQVPPMAGTEDFSYVSERVPSVFLILGAGSPDAYPHHNPRMTLDESVFFQGAALYAGCAIHWLAQHQN